MAIIVGGAAFFAWEMYTRGKTIRLIVTLAFVVALTVWMNRRADSAKRR
jgi:hypothetical protein